MLEEKKKCKPELCARVAQSDEFVKHGKSLINTLETTSGVERLFEGTENPAVMRLAIREVALGIVKEHMPEEKDFLLLWVLHLQSAKWSLAPVSWHDEVSLARRGLIIPETPRIMGMLGAMLCNDKLFVILVVEELVEPCLCGSVKVALQSRKRRVECCLFVTFTEFNPVFSV